jgi:hypothetical protein
VLLGEVLRCFKTPQQAPKKEWMLGKYFARLTFYEETQVIEIFNGTRSSFLSHEDSRVLRVSSPRIASRC